MRFEPAVQPTAPAGATAWQFVFVRGQVLLPEGSDLIAPQPPHAFTAEARHYLGRLEGLDCWVLKLEAAPPGWRPTPLRAAMMGLPAPLMALAGRAAQVLEWDRTHRFCGACGTPTEALAHERARRCPACGHSAHPCVSPAMMALVWRGSGATAELLLAHSPHYAPGLYSALAGFVEPGESIEDCVHREVAEEFGVQVDELAYYGSQSWPFPHSLMVAFTARWTAGAIVRQEAEIEDAQWFRIDALPRIPPRFSVSGHLIRDTAAALTAGGRPGSTPD
jgi:NAD+ diphosphatase